MNRYFIDEALLGGAPRARHYWTNAPVTEIADADVEQTSLVKVLEKAGNGAVPARHGQKLYTIVTDPYR